ncbi:MAG: hypothetical protein JG774_1597 [Desulfomicrobiaceae bacterium]|jgi:hypothetical protein|nr:hypothetical protein [Desulfomicrobiaceae bacterium]
MVAIYGVGYLQHAVAAAIWASIGPWCCFCCSG